MPPRVTFWTGLFEPSREGLSREVDALRKALAARGPRPPVVSFSAGQATSLAGARDGVVRLAGRRWLSLAALAAVLERRGDVTHAFGGVDAWHFLRALGRRPVVFTVAIPGDALDARLYAKVSLFAVESEALAAALLDTGISPERIRIVYPGVDLEVFYPAPPPPSRPFRLLFASSPPGPAEVEARGMPLLVELARANPDIEVLLLLRKLGDQDGTRRALEALDPPPNVVVSPDEIADMPSAFASAHAVVAPFAPGCGKSCPNSIVEGLACGRPAIVSPSCGIASLLVREGAGLAPPRTVAALDGALERLRTRYREYASRARALAVQRFSLDGFIRMYLGIYDEVVASAHARAPRAA